MESANRRIIPIREMYIILILGITMLFALIYSSMALFEKNIEKIGVASIVVSNINYTLTSSESTFTSNGSSGTITVDASLTKAFDITIKNNEMDSTRYKMYYRFSNGITILNVDVGISNKSTNPNTDIISSQEEKVVRVIIKNNSSQSVTIEIGVQGGYVSNSSVTLDTGKNEMPIINEEYTDPSGANAPVLADGMIPVEYDDANDVWVKADESSAWYSYGEQKWANAVTVSSTNRSTYQSAEAGTEISMDDINSMWVWIPRYKYKIPDSIGSSSDVTSPPEIDVVFESGIEATGVDEAIYRTGITDGTNENYYTHPAFRDINNITYDSSTTSRGAWNEEITGFWAGKFETGGTADIPLVKPDIVSLTNQNVSTQFITALKFAGGTMDTSTGVVTFSGNETYGLNSSVDTHMMKNTEWGAVAILSQSQYGKMGNSDYTGTDKEVYENNSSRKYTGRSGGSPSESNTSYGTYSYNDKTCSDETCSGSKVANGGQGASTTGTIYGVYDMSGGSYEYTMGNWAQTSGRSGFTTFPESKYYDLYQGTNYSSITKEKAILGDATWETMHWYSDSAFFVYSAFPWAFRGGDASDEYAYSASSGVWSLNFDGPIAENVFSFRSLLIP